MSLLTLKINYKVIKNKNVIFDNSIYVLNKIKQSLEELNYFGEFIELPEFYNSLKKARCNNRFSIKESESWFGDSFSSKKNIKSYTMVYNFI